DSGSGSGRADVRADGNDQLHEDDQRSGVRRPQRRSDQVSRMNRGIALAVIGLLVAVSARSQEKPLMAEDVFKNIQVLKGIPVKEFMNTMGFFSAATNLNCIDCHSPQSEDLAGYAIDTPLKQTARKMITMVNTLNKANFGGQRKV